MRKPAAYYDKLDGGRVICRLCPAHCKLKEGQAGICRSRFNQSGQLFTDNYGELVTLASDPIEKKPLYHFHPGSSILSTGPNSCNLSCKHCQNWTISQQTAGTSYLEPERLVQACLRQGSLGVAFTYTEPMMWYEYIMDVAPLLRKKDKKIVLVTNGYIDPEPLEDFIRVTDAMNVDLKSMSSRFYRRICKGKLEPILDNLRRISDSPVHLEITNLVIPGENDSDTDLSDLVDFVASLSSMVPLHFSAYYPSYRMDNSPTPVDSLLRAAAIARRSLKYVFLGNVRLSEGSDTMCPGCGEKLISRSGYYTSVTGLAGGRCSHCGFETGIIQ